MAEKKMDSEPEFAAWVGIDWADRKHVWCLQAAGSRKREGGELEHKVEAVEAWVAELCRRFGHRPIAVAVEQVKGALVFLLNKYECLHIFPVPSTMTAKMREALYPSGAKDDPRDADLLLDILEQHRDKLHRLSPDDEATRRVQNLVEERRKLTAERTAQSNRLTSYLKIYFPQMVEWFEKLDMPLVCDLLERWPTLEELQKVSPEELRMFFCQHHCHRGLRERRILAIGGASSGGWGSGGDRSQERGGESDRATDPQFARGHCAARPQDRGSSRRASGFFHFRLAAGSGCGNGTAAVGCLWRTTRSLPLRRRTTDLQWDRAGDGAERETQVGAFPLGVSQVSAAKFSRMGRSFDCAVDLGQGLLPNNNEVGAATITPRYERWLSNGFASYSAAGKIGLPMTNANTWRHSRSEDRHWVST
jgi:Transposase.